MIEVLISKKATVSFPCSAQKKRVIEGICVAEERTKEAGKREAGKSPPNRMMTMRSLGLQHILRCCVVSFIHPPVLTEWTKQNHRWSCVNNHCLLAHPYVASFGPIHGHWSLDADVNNHDNACPCVVYLGLWSRIHGVTGWVWEKIIRCRP